MEIREGKYLVKLAANTKEKEQVYKLRHSIYHKELHFMGQKTDGEIDCDCYDAICDHLIISDEEARRCVGTFRFLRGKRQESTGFYSEQWFDIGKLDSRREDILELGRACIDIQYRNTRVFKMLFSGVRAYLNLYPHDYLIGLTTMPFTSAEAVNMIAQYLREKKAVNFSLGIKPKKALQINKTQNKSKTGEQTAVSEREVIKKMPTLMWAYYKYGAEFVAEPSVDVEFNPPVVDFFTIFDTKKFPDWV